MKQLTIEQKDYLQERMDEVMDWFDFEKVQKVMDFLDWQWFSVSGVPTIPDMRQYVRKSMREAYEAVIFGDTNKGFNSSGGFSVKCERDPKDNVIFFHVTFELTNWTTDAN